MYNSTILTLYLPTQNFSKNVRDCGGMHLHFSLLASCGILNAQTSEARRGFFCGCIFGASVTLGGIKIEIPWSHRRDGVCTNAPSGLRVGPRTASALSRIDMLP